LGALPAREERELKQEKWGFPAPFAPPVCTAIPLSHLLSKKHSEEQASVHRRSCSWSYTKLALNEIKFKRKCMNDDKKVTIDTL
jgi:hypothetical protein